MDSKKFKKFKKSGNLESGFQNPDPEFRIPENFGLEIFLKFHFRGGLCYKFFLKNDSKPQKSRFLALFMSSTLLHKTKTLM